MPFDMRKQALLIIFSTSLTLNVHSQDGKQYFVDAFKEQMDMLQGKRPIDFKRAVFITENAYYKGQLNYQTYCNDISAICIKLQNLIKQRGFEKYKTGGNWATFFYMKDSSAINGFKPYIYDFDDYMGDKDYTKQFITKLMRTHTGNCHSLPFLYKILCDEIGTRASLAMAPNHVYIKHIDENGKWTNVELTSGGFPRDQWIIESMSISVEAIKSGAYMAPLSDKENIALTMDDLADSYNFQFGVDKFLLDMIDTAINYYPTCIPLYELKNNCCIELVKKERKKPQPDMVFIYRNRALGLAAQAKFYELGYKDESPEAYKAFLQGMEDEKRKRGIVKNN